MAEVRIGRVGVWSNLLTTAPGAAEAVAELAELGYGAVWLGGSSDVTQAAPLVAGSDGIVLATGILNIWQHGAAEVAARHAALWAEHPGRFLLGLGASHAALVPGYHKPYSAMCEYLDGLDAAVPPAPQTQRVLAALGPRMLTLSKDRAAGAHPYLVPVEHTATARALLGAGPLLAPELMVVALTDRDQAHTVARQALERVGYLRLPNYARSLTRLGFAEDDLAGGGSDRLIDALIAWGEPERIAQRVREHHQAGADHVAIQVLTATPDQLPLAEWRELAPALTGPGV